MRTFVYPSTHELTGSERAALARELRVNRGIARLHAIGPSPWLHLPHGRKRQCPVPD